MEMDIEISGFDEIIEALEALPGLVGARVQGDGLVAAARVIRDAAKDNVPVDTGLLQRSIRTGRRSQIVYTFNGPRRIPGAAAQVRAGGNRAIGEDSRPASHAVLVEYGTVRTRKTPYLEPAIGSTTAAQLGAAKIAMERSLVRVLKQLASGTGNAVVRRLASY